MKLCILNIDGVYIDISIVLNLLRKGRERALLVVKDRYEPPSHLNIHCGTVSYRACQGNEITSLPQSVNLYSWQRWSSESSGLTLTLEECEDITLSNWSFHVSHQASWGVVNEHDFHLCNTSSWAYMHQVSWIFVARIVDIIPVLPMICWTVAYVISELSILCLRVEIDYI